MMLAALVGALILVSLASLNVSSIDSLAKAHRSVKAIANISAIQAEIKAVKTQNNILRSRIQALEGESRVIKQEIPEIYDASAVGMAVFQNMEIYAYKSKNRWVMPCDWDDCRQQKFSQVVRHMLIDVKERLNAKLTIVQLGKAI